MESIDRMLSDQTRHVRASLEHSRNRTVPKFLKLTMFSLLIEKVSSQCMDLLYETYVEAVYGDFSTECPEDCTVRTTLGLPCIHEVVRIIEEGRVFTEEDVHVFWRQIKWYGEKLHGAGEPVDLDANRVALMDLAKKIMNGEIEEHQCRSVASHWNAINCPEFSMIGQLDPEVQKAPRGRPRKDPNTGREWSGFEYGRAEKEKDQQAQSGLDLSTWTST